LLDFHIWTTPHGLRTVTLPPHQSGSFRGSWFSNKSVDVPFQQYEQALQTLRTVLLVEWQNPKLPMGWIFFKALFLNRN
jgi:hypothetical protein